MISTKLVDRRELEQFGARTPEYADQTKALLAQQKRAWNQLAAGYQSLNGVRVRTFQFDAFTITIQFNPGRMASSAAKVDDDSVRQRQCFLCLHHLPESQKGIAYHHDYLILCNPFPIFPEHYTIAHTEHIPQLMFDAFDTFLDLSKDLGKYYTVFYNGPNCGASAPDHLHFQAGVRDFMPIEKDLDRLETVYGSNRYRDDTLRLAAVDDSLRRFIVLRSSSKPRLRLMFEIFYTTYGRIIPYDKEPMMNIISLYDTVRSMWTVLLIPRGKHRPSAFFKTGKEQILVSPAAVDFGGILITPREEDFVKLRREDIVQIFGEVSLNKETFNAINEDFLIELERNA